VTDDVVDRYHRRFDATWHDDTPIDQVRFVALDSETTGLNPQTDRIITIGAVAVQSGDIVLDDAFEVLLRVVRNTAAVTVHGITRDESQHGVDEPEAVGRFLGYLRDGVIVGHHINAERRVSAALGIRSAQSQPGYDGSGAAPRTHRRIR
jgi:DNA polymerase III epsilon subunit-like protein